MEAGSEELGPTNVLALQLGFEVLDLLVLGVRVRFGLAAILEGQVRILEQQLLPGVEDRGFDAQLTYRMWDTCPFSCWRNAPQARIQDSNGGGALGLG